MNNTFEFELNDTVLIKPTHQIGKVIGRAEYTYAEKMYLVTFVNGNGNVHEEWYRADILDKFEV